MKNKRQVVRIIALILGGLALLFFSAFIFAERLPDIWNIEDPQLKTMLLLMAFAAFGYFFSFFKSKEGGMVLTFSGVLLGLNMFYHGGTGDTKAALIYSMPFLVTGLLLWWIGTEKSKR